MEKIIITTACSTDGWTTTVTMPDGRVISKTWKRNADGFSYGCDTQVAWEEEKLPDCVVTVADQLSPMDICSHLEDLK